MDIAKYIKVMDKNDSITAYLKPDTDGVKSNSTIRQNGESILTISLPNTSDKWSVINPESQFEVYGRIYTILNEQAIEMRREGKAIWGSIKAVERWIDLDGVFAEPRIDNSGMRYSALSVTIVSGGSNLSGNLYQTGTAGHALYALLNGTGWSIGTVDIPGIHDLETERISILKNIEQIQQIWGGILLFDSINKTISLRDETTYKIDRGFQIRYSKNEKTLDKIENNKIYTRLYVYGNDDLNISSVNNGKEYVENYSYTTKKIIGIYSNPDIRDPAKLLEAGTKELEKVCKPRYTYISSIIDLSTLPMYNHEELYISDIATVIDSEMGANDKVRVIQITRDIFQPWQCSFELGEPLEREEDRIAANLNTSGYVQSTVDSRGQLPGGRLIDGSVSDTKIESLTADKITAGTITALIQMVAPLILGGEIIGGAIKTSNLGERIEILDNGIKSYNSDNQLQGFVTENTTTDLGRFGDIYFYVNGVPALIIQTTNLECMIKPLNDVPLRIGWYDIATTPLGDWDFAGANILNLSYLNSEVANHEYVSNQIGLAIQAHVNEYHV